MTPRYHHRPAFTLVELLIVIAIISILALIAIPNFMEASMRSRVARAHSDMRVVAGAIEVYAQDYQTYPPDADDLPGINPMNPAWLAGYDQKVWYTKLTTPIGYLSSIPTDPFHKRRTEYNPVNLTAYLFPSDPPHPFAYITPLPHTDLFMRFGGRGNSGYPRGYSLISLGPSATFDSVDPRGALLYDPSNGIQSKGDLVRTGGENAVR